MAHYWHSFSSAEFVDECLIVQLPSSGLFARISGPIVELLSQLPFARVEEAVVVWQERTGVSDDAVRRASRIWCQLMDWNILKESAVMPEGLICESVDDYIVLVDRNQTSRITRFLDVQDVDYGEDFFESDFLSNGE